MAGGLFGDTSLRVQWRLAQAVVGFPIALWLVLWVMVLLIEPSAAAAQVKAILLDPRALLPLVGALGFVLWVDRHLEKSKAGPGPSAATGSEPPHGT